MVFRDLSWVAARTNAWDAIGVASYGMVFALVETIAVFVVVSLLGLFTPTQWTYEQRIGFLSLLVLITSAWAMFGQLSFLWNLSLPDFIQRFLRNSNHPFRYLYGGVLAVVTATVLLPVYWFIRSRKASLVMKDVVERFSVVVTFYLVFDLLGLIIVIFRNIV
jgi:hypothetical protein